MWASSLTENRPRNPLVRDDAHIILLICVVLLTVQETNYIPYILNRIVDTGIGVGLSLFINWMFPPPQDQHHEKNVPA